ncbi:MAG: AbrB/MazE/SpoVT family DNA-binding domain-containing protein [Candidatus Dormibacteraceae bacterium]
MVIPKALRDEVGIGPGGVEIVADGAGLRIEVEPQGRLVERDGHLLLSPGGLAMDDAQLREFRLANER